MTECFRAFTSCSSKASARSTASPYPWSMPDFCRDLSATSCSRQQLSTGYSESTADRLLKGVDNSPSSTAQPGASPPSDELPPPGQQGRLPGVQPHHNYSWRLLTLAPSGLAPHPESPANGRLLPEFDSGSTSSRSSPAIAGASPLATSISSGAPPAAPWASSAWPSMGTASGIALPSASAPVNKKTTG
jgi:hypothetical protein